MGDELGGGDHGVVRRARDTLLDRDVAVKEVRFPSDGRDQYRARLLREAQAAAGLNHPGAVTIFDVVDEDGSALIVMELVDAPTLAELVEERGPLPPRRAAAIGAELLDTLVAAHEAGLVHRDVKPSNVMVSGTGRVRLADFGVAAALRSGQGSSSPFASPEQAEGAAVGAASDLWSLGATLFFAVEGRPPERTSPRPTVRSGPLGPVLSSMMTPSPDERPSPYTLRQMLARVAAGSAASAPGSVLPVSSHELEDRDGTATADTADLIVPPEAVTVPPLPGQPDGPVGPGGPGPTVIPEPGPPAEPDTPPMQPAPSPAEPAEPAPSPEPARPVPPEIVPPVEPEPTPSPEPPEIVPPVEPEPMRPAEPEIVPPTRPEIVPPAGAPRRRSRPAGPAAVVGAVPR